MSNNIRWEKNLGSSLIKKVSMGITRHYWICDKCHERFNANLSKPTKCNTIIEFEIDFDKFAESYQLLNGGTLSSSDIEKEYKSALYDVEKSEGYVKRKDHDILCFYDQCMKTYPMNIAKNLKRCDGTSFTQLDADEILEEYEQSFINEFNKYK